MKQLSTLIILLFSIIFAGAQTIYVTQAGAGSKNGSNWANAWDAANFADNINTVPSGTAVWVAKGNYKPTKDSLGNIVPNDYFSNRSCTFWIPSGVKLYGGFAGNETSVEQRVHSLFFAVNMTALDGGGVMAHYPDMSNAWNLITLKNSSQSTVIDGFYFYNFSRQPIFVLATSNAESSPTIIHCNFGVGYTNAEGGIQITAAAPLVSKPKISGCFFYHTSYFHFVPITSTGSCQPEISNCIFSKSMYDNGSLVFQSKGGSVTNCTFYTKQSVLNSPAVIGVYGITDSLYVSNCIFRDDSPGNGYIHNFLITGSNLVSLRNSNVQVQTNPNAVEPATQSGNISANPGFTDSLDFDGVDNTFGTTDDGLQLKINSASKNTGFNDYIPATAVDDILGKNRVSGCTVDMGAYEYQIPNNNIIVLPQSNVQSCTQYPIPDSVTTFIDPSTCQASATVNPVGANPVTGIVQVCVITNATVPVIAGVPYVQRHYNIEPLINASSSTARITVYYTQQEFDNYNAVATTFPQLPTSAIDVAGKANIRIEQDHGISLTGVPGTYNGTTVYIDPIDTDIIWNSTSNIWEVSFDITGFSGFFLTTALGPVPVTLVSFTGQFNGAVVKLNWKTTAEYSFRSFDIEKSNDGINFRAIQTVNASGDVNGHDYTINDPNPFSGKNFYRLKMTDIDGTYKYSSIVFIKTQNGVNQSFSISPNPAVKFTTISIEGNLVGDASLFIYDALGNKVSDIFLGKLNTRSFSTTIDLKKLSAGIYIIKIIAGDVKMSQKLIVQ